MPVLGVRRTTLVTEEALTLNRLGAGERNCVQLIKQGRSVVHVKRVVSILEVIDDLNVDTCGLQLCDVDVGLLEADTGLSSGQRAVRITGDQVTEDRVPGSKTLIERRLRRDTGRDGVFDQNREIVEADGQALNKFRRPDNTKRDRIRFLRLEERVAASN